ncbi:MAG: helix-turn-helix domain-containing protein [Pseudomonadota bacterium]
MLNIIDLSTDDGKNNDLCLAECVSQAINRYLADLGDSTPHNLYALVLEEVERPLLLEVLQRCKGHRSLAAQWLGINRNTLRKKLQTLGLDERQASDDAD